MRGICVRPICRTRGNMVPVLRPVWAFFFTKSHRCDRVRGQRRGAAALWPGPGGEAAVRFRQPMGPARCAHWPGRELAPCGLTPWPRPGLLPPLPPRWGGPGPDMCVRENTARAASVEFVRHRRTNYARSRPQTFCRKNPEGFSTVSRARCALAMAGAGKGEKPFGFSPFRFTSFQLN